MKNKSINIYFEKSYQGFEAAANQWEPLSINGENMAGWWTLVDNICFPILSLTAHWISELDLIILF